MSDIKFLKPRILPKFTEKHGCYHNSVYVVEDTRMLECQKCGKVIDPFDHLMVLAKHNFKVDMVNEQLKREGNRIREEVIELKRQKQNLQAQVRRLNNKIG